MKRFETKKKANYKKIWAAEGTILKTSAMDTAPLGAEEDELKLNLHSFMTPTDQRKSEVLNDEGVSLFTGDNIKDLTETLLEYTKSKAGLEGGGEENIEARAIRRYAGANGNIDFEKFDEVELDEIRQIADRKAALRQMRTQLKIFNEVEDSAAFGLEGANLPIATAGNPHPRLVKVDGDGIVNDSQGYYHHLQGVVAKALAKDESGIPLRRNGAQYFDVGKEPKMFLNYIEKQGVGSSQGFLQRYNIADLDGNGDLKVNLLNLGNFAGDPAVFEETFMGSHRVFYGHTRPQQTAFNTLNLGSPEHIRMGNITETPNTDWPIRMTDLRNPVGGEVDYGLGDLGKREPALLTDSYDQLDTDIYASPTLLERQEQDYYGNLNPAADQGPHINIRGNFQTEGRRIYQGDTGIIYRNTLRQGQKTTIKKPQAEAREAFRNAQRQAAMGLPYGLQTYSLLRG